MAKKCSVCQVFSIPIFRIYYHDSQKNEQFGGEESWKIISTEWSSAQYACGLTKKIGVYVYLYWYYNQVVVLQGGIEIHVLYQGTQMNS